MAWAAPLHPSSGTGRSAAAARSGSVVAWCVLAAVAVHAAIGLGVAWQAQADAVSASAATHRGTAPAGQAQPQAMRLRWAHAAAWQAARQAAEPQAEAPSAPSSEPLARNLALADEAAVLGEVRIEVQVEVQAETQAKMPAPAPAPAPADALADAPPSYDAAGPSAEASTDSDAFTGYARRHMLDRGPQPLGIVQIGYPPGVAPGQIHRGRLTLFIDEAGAVRKVMVVAAHGAADALPPPFVEAAREAFLLARFAPGERLGVAVKSRIDIEVSFDGRELDPTELASPSTPMGSARAPQLNTGADRPV